MGSLSITIGAIPDAAIAPVAKEPMMVPVLPLSPDLRLILNLEVMVSLVVVLAALHAASTEALDRTMLAILDLATTTLTLRNMEGDNNEKKEHRRRCRRHRPGCRSRHHHRDHHGHQEDESRHDIQGHGFNIDHQETVTGELDNRLKGHLDMLEALYRSSVQTIDDSYKAARAAQKDAYRAAKLAAATTATTVNALASGDTDMGDESNNKEEHDDKSGATKKPAVDCREIRQAMKEAKREWREGRAKIYDELQRQMVSVAAQMIQELTNASATAESGPPTGAVNSSSSSDPSAPFIPAHEESEKVEGTSAPMTASDDTKSDDQIPKHEQERLAFILKLQNWIAAVQTRLNKSKQGYEHTEKDHDANVAPSFGSKSCGPCHNEGGCPSVQGYPYFYYGFHGNGHPLDPNDEGVAEGTSTGGSFSSLPPYSSLHPYPSMFATHPRFAHKLARLHEKHMRQCGRMMHKFERKMERTPSAMMHADRRQYCHRERGRNCRGEEEDCHTDVSEKPTLVSTDKDKKDKQKKTFQRDNTNDTTLTMDFDSKSVNKQDHSDDSISSSDFEDDSDSDLDFELALGLEDSDSCGGENEKKTDRNGDCNCNNEEDMDE
ncbi:hypothetical protein BGW42_004436 [Actinomortierella wolfii]|nr:hypothetical protein BGW42_004436 [Actinomortierella wolfii]